jgi:hypothetical protein
MSADLADHTDTDAEQHWTARRVLAHVLEGRPYDERLSARELAAYVDPGPSAVRDLVADLRRDFGLAVYSRGSGYWHLQTDEELRDAIHREANVIQTKRDTIDDLRDAYHASTPMTRRRKPPAVFARETADTSDEYAKHRIKNCDAVARLNAIIEVEAERDDPRRKRIAWANARKAEVRE